MHRQISLSPKLSTGTYRILSERWMRKFFVPLIPRWYPGYTLSSLHISYKKPIDFKMNVRYVATVRDTEGKTEERHIRANVPSVHTTRELRAAYQATVALWNRPELLPFATVSRPLRLEKTLRGFFYEEVSGTPLLHHLHHSASTTPVWLRRAGRWLATLHTLGLTTGRRLSLHQEMKNVHYFSLNYEGYGEFIQRFHPDVLRHIARGKELLHRYRNARRSLEPRLQKTETLNHGDFHPSNVLLDPHTHTLAIIDFGNSLVADPFSDVANTMVQLDLLPLTEKLPAGTAKKAQDVFLRSYTNGRVLTRDEKRRFALFTLRWSLQTLSYTLALIVKYDKRPILYRSLQRAGRALQDL